MAANPRRRHSPHCGFTLIELVTTITLSAIVAILLGGPFIEGVKTRNRFNVRQEILADTRPALEIMARELRGIGKSGAVASIATASASQVDFGVYSYRLSGTTLQRSSDSGTTYRTVLEDVSSLAITYQDLDGTLLTSVPLDATDRGNVRRVFVDATVTRNSEVLSMRSGAYLRTFAFASGT